MGSRSDLEKRILEHVSQRSYQPLKPKVLAAKLAISRPQFQEFRRVIRQLLRSGRLEKGKNQTLRVPVPHGTVSGIFERRSGGFGFVRPHAGPGGPRKDVFIPRTEAGDAATGDEVLVRVVKRPTRPGRNAEGRILQVIERATNRFVGTYFEEEGRGYVRVDGTLFFKPVYVGDPGAKGANPGDKVVFEMLRFPAPGMPGEGVLSEILGPRGAPGVDTLSIIREYKLPDAFPDDALEEARTVAREFEEAPIGDREDLTRQTTVTIDPVDARDFDDAVSVRRDRKGHWHLDVHIADVSHFVRPGGALDREARKRGTSVYLPDRVLPMLPEVLSNGLASLQQRQLRYVKSARMEFDPNGVRLDAQFCDSAIKVTRRLDYGQVTGLLESPDDFHGKVGAKVARMLEQAKELALILRRRRYERGALELFLPEVKVDLDEEGKVCGAHFVPHDVSHQIIEEFMLAANEAVAEYLEHENILFLRRVHEDPDPHKLRAFGEFANSLGLKIRHPQSRFELQKVVAEAENRPEVYAVNYALLRSLKQAHYSPADEGHYALASDCYCHFTSPIRRYPDLQVHRVLSQLLKGDSPPRRSNNRRRAGGAEGEILALGEHCTLTEKRAEQAERQLTKIKLLSYLRERIGLEVTGVITGVEDFGFFAQGEDLPIDGLVHVSTLSDDYYYLEDATHTLVGRSSGRRYRLGDTLRLRVARVDLDRRQLDFQIVEKK